VRLAGITYVHPSDRVTWDRIAAARPAFVTINPASGPGPSQDQAAEPTAEDFAAFEPTREQYAALATRLQSLGIAVLVYVATTYGAKPIERCQREAQRARDWYGADGILWDECSPDTASWWRVKVLNGKAKSFATPRSPDRKGWAVFNAGRTDGLGMAIMAWSGRALWCTAEMAAADYVPGARTRWPARELHIVHTATDATAALRTIEASGVGYGFATTDGLPNPYDTWPRYRVDDTLAILGPPLVTVDQAVAVFARNNPVAARRAAMPVRPVAELAAITETYAAICDETGVSLAVALAQMAHEASWCSSWWSQDPRRNPAGIGASGGKGYATQRVDTALDDRATVVVGGKPVPNPTFGRWIPGLSFADWHAGVEAHVGRLLGYALRPEQMTAAQVTVYQRAVARRPLPAAVVGSAQRLRELGQAHNPSGLGWAKPGLEYGAGIARAINEMTAI